MPMTVKLFVAGVEKLSVTRNDSMRHMLNLYEAARLDAELAIRDIPGATPANTYATKEGTMTCPECAREQTGIGVWPRFGGDLGCCNRCHNPYKLGAEW